MFTVCLGNGEFFPANTLEEAKEFAKEQNMGYEIVDTLKNEIVYTDIDEETEQEYAEAMLGIC